MLAITNRSTIVNDGSVSDDPCQQCEGRLVLRNVRSGGFFLGCSNFATKGCTFKMAPNTEQLEELAKERIERKKIREAKRAERDRIEREKATIKRRRAEALKPKFCEECFSSLSNVDIQSGLKKHRYC